MKFFYISLLPLSFLVVFFFIAVLLKSTHFVQISSHTFCLFGWFACSDWYQRKYKHCRQSDCTRIKFRLVHWIYTRQQWTDEIQINDIVYGFLCRKKRQHKPTVKMISITMFAKFNLFFSRALSLLFFDMFTVYKGIR